MNQEPDITIEEIDPETAEMAEAAEAAESGEEEPPEGTIQQAIFHFLTNLRWGPGPIIPNLITALAKATLEFDQIKKDSDNPFYKNRYADLAEMIGATRSQLAKHELVIVQFPGIAREGVVCSTVMFHSSGEWLGGDLPLPVARRDAQGIGSGITYSRRYSYGPITNTAGEIDDDANAAVGSRKEHLAKLDQKFEAQARVSPAMVKAFFDACEKGGKTKSQIEKYLNDLNGYRQAEELTKQHFNEAIKWALSKGESPKAKASDDLMPLLEQSVDIAKLRKQLWTIAGKKKIPNDDVYRMMKEIFHAEDTKDLSGEELQGFIKFLDQQPVAG